MKKQTQKLLGSLAIFFLIFPCLASAHQGRLDSMGGHHDYKNKSGLGSYHYHCGDYPAHLHTNGVCMYKSGGASAVSNGSSSLSSRPAAISQTASLNRSQVRTFINGAEIPTFTKSDTGTIMIIAEDLQCYGFDETWNSYTKSLTVEYNANKEISPIDMNYYNNFNKGQKIFSAYSSDISVDLYSQGVFYGVGEKCNTGGYMAVPVDDLSVFGKFIWNEKDKLIDIIIK